MREFLPEYTAGTLPPPRHAEVTQHLLDCAACRTELDTWRAIAGPMIEPPGAEIVRRAFLKGVLASNEPREPRAAPWRWGLPVALLRAQARLVPASWWVGSALAMVAVVFVAYESNAASFVLGLAAPIAAALSAVGLCSRERDPAFEVCAAVLTGPRLVMLARVTLVLGYELALALAGSGMLWTFGLRADGLAGLVTAWLGPTALLSSLALLAAVVVGAEPAAAAATTGWLLRVAAAAPFDVATSWLAPVRAMWTTNPATVGVAVVLLAVTTLLAGRREPLRRGHATYLT